MSHGEATKLKEFKDNLRACLDEVEHDGTFFAFSRFNTYTNPGLHIASYGPVGLPVSCDVAGALAQRCKQAAFRKGSETTSDISVRKTWELDASEFQCKNPAWEDNIKALVESAVVALGIEVSCRAEPPKLLLYEEGAFSKAHKDTEKVDAILGTMVVCLPSEHSGGEVLLVHGQDSQLIETAPSSQYQLSYLAWASGVQHEIRPITSGYRLVLTYNLVQNQTQPGQAAAVPDHSHARLDRILGNWKTSTDLSPGVFIYPLEHKYTEASLSLQNLKGSDGAKGRCLQQICPKNGVYWFLGRLTRKRWHLDHGEGDEDRPLAYLDQIVTPHGERTFQTRHIDEEAIFGTDDLYSVRSRDSEDKDDGEITGNEGMRSMHRYHDTVLILMERGRFLDNFTFSNFRITNFNKLELFRTFTNIIHDDPLTFSDEANIAITDQAITWLLYNVMMELARAGNLPHHRTAAGPQKLEADGLLRIFSEVSEDCFLLGKANLVSQAWKRLDCSKWSSCIFLLALIAKLAAKDVNEGKEDCWNSWFGPKKWDGTLKTLNAQRILFRAIKIYLPKWALKSFEDWGFKTLKIMHASMSIEALTEDDVLALKELVPWLLEERYYGHILEQITRPPFRDMLVKFVTLVAETNPKNPPWNIITEDTLRTVLNGDIAFLALSMQDIEFAGHSTYAYQLLTILDRTLALGLNEEASKLITNFLPHLLDSDILTEELWENLFCFTLEFAERLEQCHIQKLQIPITWSHFVKWVLENLRKYHYRSRPLQYLNWTRDYQVLHHCRPCLRLRQFLGSPTEEVHTFEYAKVGRNHLLKNLPRPSDYETHIDLSIGPNGSLVIRKTHNSFLLSKQQWIIKILSYQDDLKHLQTDFMKGLLGERYEHLAYFLGLETTYEREQPAPIPVPEVFSHPPSFPGSLPPSVRLFAAAQPHSQSLLNVRPGPSTPAPTGSTEEALQYHRDRRGSCELPPITGVKRKATSDVVVD